MTSDLFRQEVGVVHPHFGCTVASQTVRDDSGLPNFVLPGDVSASKRYWERDIISPAVEVSPQGTINVSEATGFGYEVDRDYLRHVTVREETLT